MRLLLALLMMVSLSGAALADGTVYFIEGTVEVKAAGAAAFQRAQQGMEVHHGDVVATRAASRAFLLLDGSSNVRMDANTEIVIGPTQVSAFERIKMTTGRLWVEVTRWGRAESQMEVETPHAVAAVRGTVFEVECEASGESVVRVHEGEVDVTGAAARTFKQPAGTAAKADAGGVAEAGYLLDPWAFYNLEAAADRSIDRMVDMVIDGISQFSGFLEKLQSMSPRERKAAMKNARKAGAAMDLPENTRRRLATYLAAVRVNEVEGGQVQLVGFRARGPMVATRVQADQWIFMREGKVRPLSEATVGLTGIAVLPVRLILTDAASLEPARPVIKERIAAATSRLARGTLESLDDRELVMRNAKGEQLKVASDKLGAGIALVVNGRRLTKPEFAAMVKPGTPCLWIKRNNRWAVLLALP